MSPAPVVNVSYGSGFFVVVVVVVVYILNNRKIYLGNFQPCSTMSITICIHECDILHKEHPGFNLLIWGRWSCVKAFLIVYVYASTHTWHVMPKVSTQVYMLDREIWKLFRPRGNRQKRTKCDQFFCPTSDFFDFCNPYFFYHTFTNDLDFVDKAYAEICDHSLFTLQFC